MGILLGFLLIFVIVLVVLLALSIGVAFLLHWMLPAVGLEMALLIAVIAVAQVMLIFARLVNTPLSSSEETEDEREQRPIVILDQDIAFPRRRRRRP